MLKQILGKMNIKRLAMTTVAVFAYIFVTDFIIHGFILESAYKDSASLWRPEEEMKSHLIWMILGQFLMAKFLSVLYARGFEGKGKMEGFRFGLLLAPLTIAPSFIQFAVTPLPQTIFCSWVGLGFIQAVLGGVIAGLVYRK